MMRWFVRVHNAISRVVLGKRLVEKTRQNTAKASASLERLKQLEADLNEKTQEIARESGVFATNGNGH